MITPKIESKILIAALSISSALFLPIASFAGSQSLLDPYANIQPNLTTDSKPLGERTTKKPPKHNKVKTAKAAGQNTVEQNAAKQAPVATKATANNNPGFLSGMKEIQHGCSTSFKSAGHAIVSGSKAAGSTIAAGGSKVKDGFSAAGHKIGSGSKALVAKAPHVKKQKQQVASNMRPAAPATQANNMSAMPGRPLGEVSNTLPNTTKVKAPKVGAAQKPQTKKGLVARTFDKINIFNKPKKPPANITAANQTIIPQ